ncbi:MAG: S-layer homology domain-containing protein, partial [Oscillospiraceae bacterium]|nr:S-layer homology domain-containing protein [Oscillospiraceae bacterium]
MSKSKRLMSLLLVLATVFALLSGVSAFAEGEDAEPTAAPVDNTPVGTFTDVTWANPYAEAIAVLAAASITKGTGEGTFAPSEKVTREQVAMFIARAANGVENTNKLLPSNTKFTDVPSDDTYSGAISWCISRGAIDGWQELDGTWKYGPKNNVTILQILKILDGVLGVSNVAPIANDDNWQTNVISYAVKLGLLEDITFTSYNDEVTREQMAQFILNAISAHGYTEYQKILGQPFKLPGVWVRGADPLYEVNFLSRVQAETPGTAVNLVTGGIEVVNPFGELAYQWKHTLTTKAITDWKLDTKNEKVVGEPIVITEDNYAQFAYAWPNVFKVFLNGECISGQPRWEAVADRDLGRYASKEYVFDGASRADTVPYGKQNAQYSAYAKAFVTGNEGHFNFTKYGSTKAAFDPSWIGAKITVYEQKLSGLGEYDLVTGQYSGIDDIYGTSAFDGIADKIIVTYEYLGEVVSSDKTPTGTYYDIAL